MGELSFAHFLKLAWPYLVVAVPGVWAAFVQFRRFSSEDRKERSDLVKIAQDAAGAVIQDLRDEADRLRQRLEAVEAELNGLRKEHAMMLADKDAQITLLKGEKNQLQAELDALKRWLAKKGIEVPTARGEVYWELDGGEVHEHLRSSQP